MQPLDGHNKLRQVKAKVKNGMDALYEKLQAACQRTNERTGPVDESVGRGGMEKGGRKYSYGMGRPNVIHLIVRI